jgi:hypothetical protein
MPARYVSFDKKTVKNVLEGFFVTNIAEIEADFKKKVFPKYRKILERLAKQEAKKISRSGDLAKGVYTTGGRTGQRGVELRVKGPARKYARIINKGGVIYAKSKLLTFPTKENLDRKGRTKKTMWQLAGARTFTVTPSAGKWNKVRNAFKLREGEKVVFQRERFVFFRRRRRNAEGKLRKRPYKIRAVFILRKSQFIDATYWADNAYKQSLKQLHTLMVKTLKSRIQKVPLSKRGANSAGSAGRT